MQLILGSMYFSLSQFKQAASCVLLKFISEAEKLVMGHFVKLGKLKLFFFFLYKTTLERLHISVE